MRVLKVKTKPPYEILIGEDLLKRIPEDIKKHLDFGKIAIITDSKVENLYGESLLEDLKKAGISAKLFTFPEGEASKNMDVIVRLARAMLQAGFDRKDLILALGGGVVGDIAGFLASIYMRGIPFIQVPTTLLAQVDSSIGGKTGVDLPEGKNLLGTFYQPKRVYIDLSVLKTLPLSEIKNGLAEVIKYGCILKSKLFHFIKKKGRDIYKLHSEDLNYLIYESCSAKGYVVSRDEKESGLRRVLNFGHTVGHALETLSNYQVPHGYCVAVGMIVEARLSEILGIAEKPVYEPLKSLLKDLEMPYRVRDILPFIPSKEFYFTLSKDKKIWKGKLTIVLLKRIGKFHFYENPSAELIYKALEECY
ncbi:MAG: 3-dehydroquinate synthase [Caldimicrobium thiodismutans]